MACQQQNMVASYPIHKFEGECQNLKRPNDIAELLVQIYQHSDKSCLYYQQGKKLSDLWGISVINLQDYDNSEKFYQQKDKLFTQSCKSQLDGIYIFIEPSKLTGYEQDKMSLVLSRCYIDKFGGLDRHLGFFKNLPNPMIKKSNTPPYFPSSESNNDVVKYVPKKDGMFDINHYYVWYKTNLSGMYIHTWYEPEIYEIHISNRFQDFY